MPKFIIAGHKSIDRKIARLADAKTTNKICKAGMRAGLKPVQAAVKSNEPVGETGNLKRAAKIRAGKRTRKGVVRMFVLIGQRGFPGTKWYAAFRELGTKWMKANDAMKRAFDQTKKQARSITIKAIKAGVNAELKK